MNEIERVLAIGIPGFIGSSALLLGLLAWQAGKEGRKKYFRLLPIIGLSALCCLWLTVFLTVGIYHYGKEDPLMAKAFCFTGLFGAIGLAVVIARPKRTKREPAGTGQPM